MAPRGGSSWKGGADTFINACAPKFASQAIRKIYELGWKPAHYVTTVSSTIGTVLKPAGLDRSVGVMTTQYMKDATDKQWDNDPGMLEYRGFMKKYHPEGDPGDPFNVQAFASAQTMAYVLKQAGDNLTRENVLRIAANLKNLRHETVLPGILLSTTPDDYGPLSTVVMSRFDGQKWDGMSPYEVAQMAWLEAIGQPDPGLRRRMTAVLKEVRQRGFVVERLTKEYVRVYTALRALSGDGEIDMITTQLARAFADLTTIDVLPDEMDIAADHSVATISAPITIDGAVIMSVTAAVFATLTSGAIRELGTHVRATAHSIEERIAHHSNVITT
jgi:hypothetical protein